jgi:hypothetical protein
MIPALQYLTGVEGPVKESADLCRTGDHNKNKKALQDKLLWCVLHTHVVTAHEDLFNAWKRNIKYGTL